MLAEIAVILALIVANGLFAGAEIAVVSVRKTRLQELVESGRGSAVALLRLREAPERFLATVQIGITVVTATASAFGGASIAVKLTPLLARVSWIGDHADDVALALVIAALSFLSIVVGELVPKSLALRHAETFGLLASRPLSALSSLARPLVWLLTFSSNLILRPFGDRTTFTEARHSTEELQQLVDEASRAGTLHPHAGEIASRALEFADLQAADAMVPRQHVVMLPRDAAPDEVRKVVLEHPHARMPVYDGQVDNVVGYISTRDLLYLALEQKLFVMDDILRPAFFAPETQRAVDLLHEMRRRRLPFAVIVDEQGGMSGVCTLEDLLEELVGEILSEDSPLPPELVQVGPDGSAIILGTAPLRDVNRVLGIELPENGDWTTVAGLAVGLTGRIPATGERIGLPDGWTLEVLDASPRRVKRVKLMPPRPSSP